MTQLSAIIITRNEAHNIKGCIESLRHIADEIVVLDSNSEDDTASIAIAAGAAVYSRTFDDYVSQRSYSMQLVQNDWVFVMDADERLSPELAKSIRLVLQDPLHEIYECNRRTNYCGKWVNHCGWYPDRKIRLFRKSSGQWAGDKVHEYWQYDQHKTPGRLTGDLLHYSFRSIADHLKKIDLFTEFAAGSMAARGKKPGMLKLCFKPLWSFFQSYVLRLGVLDGTTGFIICVLNAYHTFIKMAKARTMLRQARLHPEEEETTKIQYA